MVEPQPSNGNRIQDFIERIEIEVDDAKRLLRDFLLMRKIELSLEPEFKVMRAQAEPREFMIGLIRNLLSSLKEPLLLSRLEQVAELLKPLKEVRAIVCSDEFNEVVAVRSAS